MDKFSFASVDATTTIILISANIASRDRLRETRFWIKVCDIVDAHASLTTTATTSTARYLAPSIIRRGPEKKAPSTLNNNISNS